MAEARSRESVFNARRDIPRLGELAGKNIRLGTSSWQYEGWLRQVYRKDYYRFGRGGKVLNKTKFLKENLSEYATVFHTVCFDGAYYRFPEVPVLEEYAKRLPDDFQMTFKCTDTITLRRFHNAPQFGALAGQLNRDFLNVALFKSDFLTPVQDVFREKLGTIIFEFSPFFFGKTFGNKDGYTIERFVGALDSFLSDLPKEVKYAVEVRDPEFIEPDYDDYLATLRKYDVSHVMNAQTWMPPFEKQVKRPGIITSNRIVVRGMTKPGMSHEAAVERYKPYETTQEAVPEFRQAMAELIQDAVTTKKQLNAYINNRLEGNAPNTIAAILDIYDQMNNIERPEPEPEEVFPEDLFG